MKGLAESSPFHLLTNPHVINRFIFGHGVVIYYIAAILIFYFHIMCDLESIQELYSVVYVMFVMCICCMQTNGKEPPYHKTNTAHAKTKAQISCAVTAQLISTFVFFTQIVQSLFFLYMKFQGFSLLL